MHKTAARQGRNGRTQRPKFED